MKNRAGFTKVELLVVGAIIGILGLMAIVAVSTARARTRDAVRLSDIRQIQNGLELYFIDNNQYPVTSEGIALGIASSSCLTIDGFSTFCASDDSVYLKNVPAAPTAGLTGAVTCSGVTDAYCYLATEEIYAIEFELEYSNPLLALQKGVNCALPSELKAGKCSP